MSRTRSDRVADLGELQLQVLQLLFDAGEGTVYDVLDRFPEVHRPRYTTVLTVLRNLEKKGLVAHRTVDRTYVFRPVMEPAQVRSQVLKDVLDRAFGGSAHDLMAALLDVDAVTPEVLTELKALIEEREVREDDA
jgi:predicted transcriptional regulator